jgi:protein phosphatase methylesterase 1
VRYITTRYPESNIILLGHSLGGSIGIKMLNHINQSEDCDDLKERVVGNIVVDVVEGTALEALPHMHLIVKNK